MVAELVWGNFILTVISGYTPITTSKQKPVNSFIRVSIPTLHGLYAITDSHLISEHAFGNTTECILRGGANIIQYRDKSNDNNKRLTQTRILRKLCNQYQTLLIINDDIELAIQSNADGIHLGRDDTSFIEARKQLGKDAFIGVSCYNDIELAIEAEKQGANYVAFGAVYPSPTKPHAATASLELLTRASSQLNIPICAIGGINLENAPSVINTGIDMIAVISDLYTSSDIQTRSKALSKLFM